MENLTIICPTTQRISVWPYEYEMVFVPSTIQALCLGLQAKWNPDSLQEYLSKALREDPFSAPSTTPLPISSPLPPTRPIKSSLAVRCSSSFFSASFVHLSQPPTHLPSLGLFALSHTCMHLHLATLYVLCFIYSCSFCSFIIIRHLEILYVY